MARPFAFPPLFSNRVGLLAACALLSALPAAAQVFTVSSKPLGPIDRRYAQVEPTKVELPKNQINARGHQDILRALVAEQGFAMRPLPRGKHGLTLEANGQLKPAGEGYMNEVTVYGLSVKPGDRLVLSNVRIDKDRIVFDINGGPQRKHEFMRHVQIGIGGPDMTSPVVQGDDQEPVGSRIVLTFHQYVPDVTPAQVKALLAPLISFDVKTPVQAFTDTLPPRLRQAILDHHVIVGMNTEMVLYALGQPDSKSREMDGQNPFEEWIYGKPPRDVEFVRVNGNRVIRVEVAKLGQPLEVYTKDEVAGMLMTDGRSVEQAINAPHEKKVQLGDAHPDLDRQAAAAPPSLRQPGEKLPQDADMNKGVGDPTVSREQTMGPVLFPKDTNNDPARTLDVAAARRAEQAAKAKEAAAKGEDASKAPDAGKTPDAKAKPAEGTSGTPAKGAGDAPKQSTPAPQSPAPQGPPASNFLAERTPAAR
ncbi:MAG TPA: hypothetical protein VL346_08040 [Acidobacteriaceae bacterium]|nr:hypothetical protein [Acidobacteriaceae bacterium]